MAAKKKTKNKKTRQKAQANNAQDQSEAAKPNGPAHASVKGEDLIYVSPSRVRFQHSKIRPVFSGCGRSVTDTLEEIRGGKLEPGDLPPIQVIIGPDENDGLGPWYFSLNNRRLWVLKECYKEGLLDNGKYNNKIPVRVRFPKSGAESERYSVDNCALEAKFMREKKNGGGGKKHKGKQSKKDECDHESDSGNVQNDVQDGEFNERSGKDTISNGTKDDEDDDDNDRNKKNDWTILGEDSSDSESDDDVAHQNPFSALL